jgi:hypothetical protein
MIGRPRRLVSVGDLVRAIGRLEAPREQWGDIARLLGFELLEQVDEKPERAAAAPPRRERPTGAVPDRGPRARPVEAPAQREPVAEDQGEALPSVLVPLGEQAAAAPLWIHTTLALEQPWPATAARTWPLPLLTPDWKRGVLEELLTTVGDDGPIDVLAAVAALARQESMTELPRLPRPTLSRGVQVLVDRGPGMVPFAADQASLVADLKRMASADGLEVVRFVGSPLDGAGSRRQPKPWRPPVPARPVLILSDLGAGPSGAPPSAWVRTAAVLRHAGCPAVALCPYPIERVPHRIRRSIAIVEWDRPTTARSARSDIGGLKRVAT